jgi:hypothetical protein
MSHISVVIRPQPAVYCAGGANYFDTMYPGWLGAAAEALVTNGNVEIYDWRKAGGRWIDISLSDIDPRKPIEPALKRLLRREGVRRFRR